MALFARPMLATEIVAVGAAKRGVRGLVETCRWHAPAEERTHPTYFSLAEQWERHVQAIQQLPPGHAFVQMPDDRVYRIRTRTLPKLTRRSYDLEVVKQEYLQRYFTPPPTVSAPAAATTALPAGTQGSSAPEHPTLPVAPPPQVIGRRSPRRDQSGTPSQTLFISGADPDADAA